MTTVAIFSTYAPSEGFGGPARVFHTRRVLEAAGHDVIHVVVQGNPSRGQTRSTDIVKLVERPYRAALDHIYEDVDLGARAAADSELVTTIVDQLDRRRTDLLILEQPYLVELVEQVAARIGAPVIYSAANVEYRLKLDLERFQRDWRRASTRSEEVRRLEQRAIDLAAAVTAICPTDRDALRAEFGCTSTLVPNGSSVGEAPSPSYSTNDPTGGHVDFVTAGSAYWPNIEGMAIIASPSLAFLPPTTRIHVAGSMSSQLLAEPTIARHYSVNSSRLVLRGFLEMEELISTMRAARAVIVPVFTGEGSNLKSADALACGRPVIMTTRATRGYEDVLAADADGVTVVDSGPEFRHAMKAAIEAEPATRACGLTRRDLLQWRQRLAPLLETLSAVARQRSAST